MSRWSPAARVMALAAAAFVLLYVVLVLTTPGQRLDASLWRWRDVVPPGLRTGWSEAVRHVVPVIAIAVLVGERLVTRRPGRLLRELVMVAVVAGLAHVLRDALPRPYLGNIDIPINTYPSTHVALATAPLVALAMTSGRRSRVTRGCAVAVALTAAGNTVAFAHRPSDVAGGVLLAVVGITAISKIGQRR